MKYNGLGKQSAISDSIPEPYRRTQSKETLEYLYPKNKKLRPIPIPSKHKKQNTVGQHMTS